MRRTADYTLSAKITGDESKFKKAFGSAASVAEGFAGTLQSVSAKAVAVGQVVGNAIGKIASKMGQVATQGVKYNAQIEDYTASFKTMTGSADKAAETIDNLKKLGASTPFELSDLAETTKLLMNYGFTADDAQDKLMMLGDISQGSADKMQRVATAYGQMSSAGKVSLEDVKQMIEAGFNPLQEISESTGESMASLYDRISDGAISVDEITASMTRATSEGGKYFKSMETQSKTFNGQMSTLKDNASQILGAISNTASSALTGKILPIANETLGAIVDKFNEGTGAGDAFKTGLSTAADAISEKFPNLSKKISSTVETIKTKFQEITGMDLSTLQGTLGSVFDKIKNSASDVFTQLKTDIENGVSPFDAAKGAAGNFADSLVEKFPVLCGVINSFKNSVDSILTVIKPVFETVGQCISEFTGNFKSGLKEAGGEANGFSGVIKAVTAFINPLMFIIKNFAPQISELVSKLSGPLSEAFGTLGKVLGEITAKAGPIFEELINAVGVAIEGVVPLIAQLAADLLPMISEIVAAVAPVIMDLLSSIVPLITTIVTELMPILQEILAGIMPIIKEVLDIVINLFTQIMPFISQLIEMITPFIGQLMQMLVPLLNTIFGALQKILEPIMKLVNQLMPPIISIIESIMAVVEALLPVVMTVIEAVIAVISPIIDIVAGIISGIIEIVTPIITFIADVIAAIVSCIAPIIEAVKSIFGKVFDVIGGIINGIKGVFDGFMKFFEGVFCGDWEKAWEGIKTAISIVWDGIWSVIKGVVNLIIDGINMLWGGIYSAVSGIVNSIGGIAGALGSLFGQDWSFSMPAEPPLIPKLARGTDDFRGGLARINEGGRGELVALPNGTQVIPHDISVSYAREAARVNRVSAVMIDYDYLINGITLAMSEVRVTHNTVLDSRTVASSTSPLINRRLGDSADLEKRFA